MYWALVYCNVTLAIRELQGIDIFYRPFLQENVRRSLGQKSGNKTKPLLLETMKKGGKKTRSKVSFNLQKREKGDFWLDFCFALRTLVGAALCITFANNAKTFPILFAGKILLFFQSYIIGLLTTKEGKSAKSTISAYIHDISRRPMVAKSA